MMMVNLSKIILVECIGQHKYGQRIESAKLALQLVTCLSTRTNRAKLLKNVQLKRELHEKGEE